MNVPAFYDGVADADYHAPDWTPEPALSSSGARMLDARCPAKFWWKYMRPEREEETKRIFTLGKAAHLLVLEPHRFEDRVVRIPNDNYQNNGAIKAGEARQMRDDAYAAGKLPLVLSDAAQLDGIRAKLAADPVAKHAFAGGAVERSYVWRDPETQILCKARLDHTPDNLFWLRELKTTDDASEDGFQRTIWNLRYHMQAAWYMDACQHVLGERPKKFSFIAIEREPPYVITIFNLDDETLGWAAEQNARARRKFAECLETGDWHEYRGDDGKRVVKVGLPPWARRSLEMQHEAGRFLDRTLARELNPMM